MKLESRYYQQYIGGKLVGAQGGRKEKVFCPATDEVIGEIAWASAQDAENALQAAKSGFEVWSKFSLKARTDWMLKLRDAVIGKEKELREAIMFEMGKTYPATEEDYQMLVDALQWYPEAMKRKHDEILPDEDGNFSHKLVAQPAGVAVAYLAWNFPLLNLAYKIAPALAAGCSIILHPSPVAPISAYLVGEILESVDFPNGVVNILTGPPEEVANTLSSSKITRVLTMIGSTETAKKVIAASATSIKKMSLELGGNAPVIVFEDAEVEKAVADVAALKTGNSGQICVTPNRIFVHESVHEQFVEGLKAVFEGKNIGFGIEENPDMGPMIDKRSRDRVKALVEDDVANGATLVTGGKIPAGMERGAYFEPTLLTGITPSHRSFKEEIFGPVAAVVKFSSEEEVLELANQTEYGLASYVYTQNNARVARVSAKLDFGEVQVNGFKYAIYLPHGGIKDSGIGHDCSHLALEDYLVKKRISMAL